MRNKTLIFYFTLERVFSCVFYWEATIFLRYLMRNAKIFLRYSADKQKCPFVVLLRVEHSSFFSLRKVFTFVILPWSKHFPSLFCLNETNIFLCYLVDLMRNEWFPLIFFSLSKSIFFCCFLLFKIALTSDCFPSLSYF